MASELEFRASQDEQKPDYPQAQAPKPSSEPCAEAFKALVMASLVGAPALMGADAPKAPDGALSKLEQVQPPRPLLGDVQPPRPRPQPLMGKIQPPRPDPELLKLDTPPRIKVRAPLPPLRTKTPPELIGKTVRIEVKVQVDPQGRPQKATDIASSQPNMPECLSAAKEAAMASRFSPALSKGRPVEGWCTLTYDLKLK